MKGQRSPGWKFIESTLKTQNCFFYCQNAMCLLHLSCHWVISWPTLWPTWVVQLLSFFSDFLTWCTTYITFLCWHNGRAQWEKTTGGENSVSSMCNLLSQPIYSLFLFSPPLLVGVSNSEIVLFHSVFFHSLSFKHQWSSLSDVVYAYSTHSSILIALITIYYADNSQMF